MDISGAKDTEVENNLRLPSKTKLDSEGESDKHRESRRAVRLERLNAHKASTKATKDDLESSAESGVRAKTSTKFGSNYKPQPQDDEDKQPSPSVQQVDQLREIRLKRFTTAKAQPSTTENGRKSIEVNGARAKTTSHGGRMNRSHDEVKRVAKNEGRDEKVKGEKERIAPLQYVREGRSPSERNWRDRRKGIQNESKVEQSVRNGQNENGNLKTDKVTDDIVRHDKRNDRPARGQLNSNRGHRNVTPRRDRAIDDLNWRVGKKENNAHKPVEEQRVNPEYFEDANNERERGDEHGGRGRGRGHRGGHNRNQGGRGTDSGHGQRLTTPKLKELQDQEPSVVALTLANSGKGFKDALTSAPVDLLLNVISKAFTCNSTNESLNKIFIAIKESGFFTSIVGYFMGMMTEQSERRRLTFIQPIKDMITIMEQLSGKNPNCITELMGIHAMLQAVIETLSNNSTVIDEDIRTRFGDFTALKDRLLERAKRSNFKNKREDKELEKDLQGPPNDFREIEIFPQTADMEISDDHYLRANKVKGRYDDLDHYLDVQFRLLREDFVAPLREGIAEYIKLVHERKKKKKLQDVRIYDSVRIIAPYCADSGICYTLQFDVSRLKIRWQSSKRLIYGSLLCLSPDMFETLYFATVVNRDLKLLPQGIVQVRFEVDHTTVKTLLGMTFTMAETTAYFESYRHNLSGLQNIRAGDLPFERYIVKCESEIKPPSYVSRVADAKIDLRPLVDDNFIIMDDTRLKNLGREVVGKKNQTFSIKSKPAKDVTILHRESWPPADLLHLDESQFEAIHTALTREFVITQGPPGTGKTYIGLKIVKALLHNKELWSKDPVTGENDLKPMLIVCYTNHALDQFLEGILKFYKGDVLRVGGRSNSEALKPYNLNNFRQRFRHARSVPEHIFRARRDAKNIMDTFYTKINETSVKIQIASTQILSEEFLRPFMGERHYTFLIQQFQVILINNGIHIQPEISVLVEWLELGNLAQFVHVNEEAAAARENVIVQEQQIVDEYVDVEDEIDAIQARRQLQNREDSDDDDDRRVPFETRREANERKVQKAAKEQFKAVALNVDNIEEKPDNLNDGEWQMQRKGKKKMKKNIQKNLASSNTMTEDEANGIVNLWAMRIEDKWRLYRYWIQKYTQYLWRQIEEQENGYEMAAMQYKEAAMQEDKEIMRHSTIIGMTTTGAARYQSVLQEINPRIIVVEEAAEVLEAHIITTLSRGCEHLILIGDHKQLKPNPTVFNLAKDFNLDVSLFERMISNGVRCDCLSLQHRMRPEIAELMSHIYEKLYNHEDVMKYESIRGIPSDIFFINHNFPETAEEDLRSHSNLHEAAYIASLCKYLLLQGYDPEQITVLTTYSGQLFCLKRMMPRNIYEGVKVTVVDNYQGEENDIILLSLVRSNNEGSIGFLKVSNRVCVALSRAKKGFYVIGNFNLLAMESKLWKDIKLDMQKKNRIGDGLMLYCQNHPEDAGIIAREASDFDKAPEGGCSKKCDYRLDCGHVCQMFCHVNDRSHKEYNCVETCNKIICQNGHRCKKKCYQKCDKCTQLVLKRIPKCGHEQEVPCYQDPITFSCREQCPKNLECGHKCRNKCGSACTSKCRYPVEKEWPCGHSGKVMCHEYETALCPEPCDGILGCEHVCSGTCGTCFQGRLHRPCKNACNRILVCGHQCKDKCNLCPPCTERCNNRCEHSRCDKPCGDVCAPCMMACEWKCEHYKCTRLCHEPCDRPRCNEPCKKRLPCGHQCIGLCGEKCPNDCRECDKDKVTTIFFGDEDEDDARFVVLEDCRKRCIIEYKAMDKYMDTKVEKGEIKLKCCPICNTPIRRNLRYGTLINRTLQEIEDVKKKVLTNKFRLAKLEDDIKDALIDIQFIPKDELNKRLKSMAEPKSEHTLVALKNQVTFVKALEKMQIEWKKISGLFFTADKKAGMKNLEQLYDWAMEERSSMTPQEVNDFQSELARSNGHFNIIYYQMQLKNQGKVIDLDLKRMIRAVEVILTKKGIYTKEQQDVVKACLEELKEKYSGIGVSDEERLMIVTAMALPKGHWFKCPNGHVYAIGDCGGATVESTCPECKSTIGGGSHRLRSDNRLAGEMDGASHAAWSEQANLGNYGFNAQF